MSELVANNAVQKVEKLLNRAKFDEIGTFSEKSVTVQPSETGKLIPRFWTEIIKHQESAALEGCLIVMVRIPDNDPSLDTMYKCDLLISSRDLNECNFRKLLGNCLLSHSSNVYIEVSDLTLRGSERLMALLRDFQSLFDNRIVVVLVSKLSCVSSKVFSRFTAVTIESDYVETAPKHENKKRKFSPSHERESDEWKIKFEESEKKRKEMEESVSKFRHLESEHNKLENDYESLKNDLLISKSKMEEKDLALSKEAADNRSKLEDERKGKREEAAELQEEHEALLNESDAKYKNLEEEFNDLKKKLVNVQSEIDEHKLLEDKLNKVNTELKDENKQLGDEILKLKKNDTVGAESSSDVVNDNLGDENGARSSKSMEASDSEITKENVELIKNKISRIKAKCPSAGSHEILRKCFKKLHFDVKFSNKLYCDDSFVCTMHIIEIDDGYEQLINKKWVGNGKSKKIAKMEAFLSFIKCME